ncbi:MAG: nucleotidyltransferase family protein [Bacteroides sp.]
MKAMVFAAGLGTRLRPLTDHQPKALVNVGGVPMLERVILRLKGAGFDDITVNVHHFGEQIIDFLQAKRYAGVTIHISDERDLLLDTGGGILKARPFLEGNEPFLVHNADIMTDIDLGALYRHHLAHRAEATLVVSQRNTSRYLLFDAQQRLQGWTNKQTGEVLPADLDIAAGHYTPLAFSGIHVISPTLYRWMGEDPWSGKFSIIPFYVAICREARIQGYQPEQMHFFDVGKIETLRQAEEWLERQTEQGER